jgi:hypothetical protein
LGIVVLGEADIDVHLPKSLKKLQAMSSALSENSVREAAASLHAIDAFVRPLCSADSDRLAKLAELSPFDFSDTGEFFAHSQESYDIEIQRLLRRLVEPEPAPVKLRYKSSPLLSMVKRAFRQERVMAKKGEDLSTHRVIAGLQLAEGFSADLVLKNGAMHVIETVDASNPDSALKKIVSDIAVSALTIEQARILFGENDTKGRLVYHASSGTETAATPALEAAAHQGIELINWASDDDKNKFINTISSLAIPFEKKTHRVPQSIHASTQHKFNLN